MRLTSRQLSGGFKIRDESFSLARCLLPRSTQLGNDMCKIEEAENGTFKICSVVLWSALRFG